MPTLVQRPDRAVARGLLALLLSSPLCALAAEDRRPDDDFSARERRHDAHLVDVASARGKRDTRNLALDDDATDLPTATSRQTDSPAILAVDGDPTTAWRGDPGAESWTWTLPFRRKVHLGLVRAHFGDSSSRGIPGEWQWEIQPAVAGVCQPWGLWVVPPGGRQEDRDGNTFLYGPREVHAQRQAYFADVEACALRLVVTTSDGGPPVIREVKILESAEALTRAQGVVVDAPSAHPALGPSTPGGIVDGTYAGIWSGDAGARTWSITMRLPATQMVDRLRLVLGHDSVTIPRKDGEPGRVLAGSFLPLRYRVEASDDDSAEHLVAISEADSPERAGLPLPIRRRLVHFAPRPIKLLRITITQSTGPWGESEPELTAPVVREIALYAADDRRPVVSDPLFLSVNANPATLTRRLKGGEAFADGLFARDAHHRLRRIILGFRADTRWPADASWPRDLGTGRFLEAAEGDDATVDRTLLEAMSPPPIVLLSGAFDWEFDRVTAPSASKRGHWSWDVLADPTSPDRGMAQLRDAVRGRVAPFVGFCGGAQILALLDAPRTGESEEARLDAVLLRNENRPIRGLLTRKDPYEHAWWSDEAKLDRARPRIDFNPLDPLFDTGEAAHLRSSTFEVPSSHGDMLRGSVFGTLLPDLTVVAHSDFCRTWVAEDGPEPTWPDPTSPDRRCVRVPQAFRSTGQDTYPLIGFQFHPEQRDLVRLLPDSAPDARGDALAVFANAVDLALDSYVRLFWPDA